jgi:hypothetical protein
MSTLNVLITHLAGSEVDAQLKLLRAVAPSSRFVVCHGGAAADYEQVAEPDKAFVDDPSLRGEVRTFQSYNVALDTVNARWLAAEPDIDSVYLFEFDHLILRADFESQLRELAADGGAGLLAKNVTVRNHTNCAHYTRFRRDEALLSHLREVSVREDPGRMYGMLACAFWLTRAAVEAYVGVGVHPRCYGEIYVPTLLYHLGFDLLDIEAVSDLYRHVRWTPPYELDEAEALRVGGQTFVHPIKDAAARTQLLRAASAAG